MILRVLPAFAVTLVLGGCLAGAGTALGGGPIGVAPDLRAGELLREPDSTRGAGFVIVSNRTDLLQEARVQLNAAARAYERLVGDRPPTAEVRLTSGEDDVRLDVRLPERSVSSNTVSLAPGGRALPRAAEPLRISRAVVESVAREWLSSYLGDVARALDLPAASSWMEDTRIPGWIRVGMVETIADDLLHEAWLMQLGRTRASLPPASELLGPSSCDSMCLARLIAPPGSPGGMGEAIAPEGWGWRRGRGAPAAVSLEGPARFVAVAYSITLFMSQREGSDYVRTVVATALQGRDLTEAFATAKSFSGELADIDRQWRVWLATFAYRTPG